MKKKKSETELMNEFYQWTLDQAKKEGVGQDVIYFKHMREQFLKIRNICSCGYNLGAFKSSCPVCIGRAQKHEKELEEIRKKFKR